MKKKIGDLTFFDKMNICKKNFKDDCFECPLEIPFKDAFTGKTLMWVCNKDNRYEMDLDQEIEVDNYYERNDL